MYTFPRSTTYFHFRRIFILFFTFFLFQTAVIYAQTSANTSNALDSIQFGSASSESAHHFIDLGSPEGTGAFGLTYREIAASSDRADAGNPADNRVLTFTLNCSATLQNYLTIQLWGSDTTPDVIYLYNSSQGYDVKDYYTTNQPEIDFQVPLQGTQSQPEAMYPGRFVYETVPIPLAMTQGKTSVTLTLNAATSYGYYDSGTTQLAYGNNSRAIYAAYTHTDPELTLSASAPQGSAPPATAPVSVAYDSSYLASIQAAMATGIQSVLNNQAFGPEWSDAVSAGEVPAEIYGYFTPGRSPSNQETEAQWLNDAATDTSAGNNVSMQRLDELAYVYVTPNLLPQYYQNPTVEQAIVAALDSYSFMQAQNGCWGDMVAWDGIGATTASATNPYGRADAQCSPIEGAGTWAIGSAIALLQNESSFREQLNQPINSTLEPGVLRYQAYQTMLVNNMKFLNSSIGPGHAPSQELLQARSYLYSNIALQALDKIYGTSDALSNSAMMPYLDVAFGLEVNQYGGLWISHGGLGLEVDGTGNGSYDGGYGHDDVEDMVLIAEALSKYGIETSSSHPLRTIAMRAVDAFTNFIYPSLVADNSGLFTSTLREEEAITFRKNYDTGEITTGSNYIDAAEFDDPYAIHAFYLEAENGLTWSIPSFSDGFFDTTIDDYLREFKDYSALCAEYNTESDPSNINFLAENGHPNGVWADPTASTIAIKQNGELLYMVLNWRPLEYPGNAQQPSAAHEVVDNIARIHDMTATTDRIATVMMPATTATGASGDYKSGAFGTLYVARYGRYLVGLNWQSNPTSMALAPDMTTGTAIDLASGNLINLTTTNSVMVPAEGAVALYWTNPIATLSTNSLTFPPTTINSTAIQKLTLTNPGNGPLMIGSITISGSNASSFSSNSNCGSTLSADASCTIETTFAPSTLGSYRATLSVLTSASSKAQTVTLTGTATNISTGGGSGSSPPPASLAMNLTPSSLSLSPGSVGTVQLLLTPAGGLSGAIALTCTSPESFITCQVPASVTLSSGAASAAISISVASTDSSIAKNTAPRLWLAGLTSIAFALLLPWSLRKPKHKYPWLIALFAAALICSLTACGSSSKQVTPPTTTPPPAGSYTLTITASGSGLKQPATTTLSVNVS